MASYVVGQDLAGTFGNQAVIVAVTPTTVPTTENAPGVEGAVAMDMNYIYTYHNGIWCKTQRLKF